MKRITLLASVALFIIGCSDDDSKKETCDCQKITATYNEQMQAYEPIATTPYSDDCDDHTNTYSETGDGTYFRINCTQN